MLNGWFIHSFNVYLNACSVKRRSQGAVSQFEFQLLTPELPVSGMRLSSGFAATRVVRLRASQMADIE